jgi:hypothetical protein
MRRVLATWILATLAACSSPPAQPVAVAGATPSPAAGTGSQEASAVPLLGMPIKAIVNGKPLAGYDLTILDPITDKPLPVLAAPPASGSAIVAAAPPKTGEDGSFKFLLVLDKAAGVISNNGGALIAGGGGNLIAGGGGNLIAGGGGNLIAGGGGNLIAGGGGNLIAGGGGNLIAGDGGNLIAGGGGNLIAGGGGNLAAAGGEVNLRVVAAGLGGRVEAVSTLTSAGFGRFYHTLQAPDAIVMDVASTVSARLIVQVLKTSESLPPEERLKARQDAAKQLGELREKLEQALAKDPEQGTKILQSDAQGTDALIGQFLATSGLAQDLPPALLSPEVAEAAGIQLPPPPGQPPAQPPAQTISSGGGVSSGGGGASDTEIPVGATIDLH